MKSSSFIKSKKKYRRKDIIIIINTKKNNVVSLERKIFFFSSFFLSSPSSPPTLSFFPLYHPRMQVSMASDQFSSGAPAKYFMSGYPRANMSAQQQQQQQQQGSKDFNFNEDFDTAFAHIPLEYSQSGAPPPQQQTVNYQTSRQFQPQQLQQQQQQPAPYQGSQGMPDQQHQHQHQQQFRNTPSDAPQHYQHDLANKEPLFSQQESSMISQFFGRINTDPEFLISPKLAPSVSSASTDRGFKPQSDEHDHHHNSHPHASLHSHPIPQHAAGSSIHHQLQQHDDSISHMGGLKPTESSASAWDMNSLKRGGPHMDTNTNVNHHMHISSNPQTPLTSTGLAEPVPTASHYQHHNQHIQHPHQLHHTTADISSRPSSAQPQHPQPHQFTNNHDPSGRPLQVYAPDAPTGYNDPHRRSATGLDFGPDAGFHNRPPNALVTQHQPDAAVSSYGHASAIRSRILSSEKEDSIDHGSSILTFRPFVYDAGSITPRPGSSQQHHHQLSYANAAGVAKPPPSPPRHKHSNSSSTSSSPSTSSSHHHRMTTPSGSGGGSARARETLTEDQKRMNHISSEKKRRDLIKTQFNQMCMLVPKLAGAGASGRSHRRVNGMSPALASNRSKSTVLQIVYEYILLMMEKNKRLRQHLMANNIHVAQVPNAALPSRFK